MENATLKHKCFNCFNCRLKYTFASTSPMNVLLYPKTNHLVLIYCRKGMWIMGDKQKIYTSQNILNTDGFGLHKYAPSNCPFYDPEDIPTYQG